MNDYARRDALRALDPARPAIARLDIGRDAEDVAADLIDAWNAVENALRTLVGGGPTSSGQGLIREARQRNLIGFEQGNALAEFQAASDRVSRTEYRPTGADVAAARDGFQRFEAALLAGDVGAAPAPTSPYAPGGATSPYAPGAARAAAPAAAAAQPAPEPALVVTKTAHTRFPVWAMALAGVVVLAILGAGAYAFFGTRGAQRDIDDGIAAYQRGQREAAVTAFQRAERADPQNPIPHVYLARMAREVGNLTIAQQEAVAGVRADTTNAIALRELGSYMLTVGRFDDARKWFVRASQRDPNDRASRGWLGCSLVKLGNFDLGMRLMSGAGQGPWSSCMPLPAGAAPGVAPTGANPAGGYPQQPSPQPRP